MKSLACLLGLHLHRHMIGDPIHTTQCGYETCIAHRNWRRIYECLECGHQWAVWAVP